MSTVTIIIPAYNEAKSIKPIIEKIKQSVKTVKDKVSICVVNDGSKDNTAQVVSKISGIKVLTHPINRGYGAALKTAIRNTDSEYIMIIDADGTYPIESIPKLIGLKKDYDMVVGARTGKIVRDVWLRKPAKWFLKLFSTYVAGTKIPDLNSGLRIFRRDMAVRFMGLYPDGFSFTSTITIASLTNNYRVKFVPINYFKRKGKSGIHPIKDFIGFNYLILSLAFFFKPLRVFAPISALLFIAGGLKLLRDLAVMNAFGLGGTILILAAIQIGFMGMLAEVVIKRTNL